MRYVSQMGLEVLDAAKEFSREERIGAGRRPKIPVGSSSGKHMTPIDGLDTNQGSASNGLDAINPMSEEHSLNGNEGRGR